MILLLFRVFEYISVTPKVNNPVTVLTQEMSKYFLHSKGVTEKYKVVYVFMYL